MVGETVDELVKEIFRSPILNFCKDRFLAEEGDSGVFIAKDFSSLFSL